MLDYCKIILTAPFQLYRNMISSRCQDYLKNNLRLSISEDADMWYAKMYFSEKKEVFQFDSHGVQGVPSTYKEFPFL